MKGIFLKNKISIFLKDFPAGKIRDEKYFSEDNTELKPFYNFTLICRDNPLSNNLIKLNCSSYDDEGHDFLGIPLCDFSKSQENKLRLTIQLEKLKQQNNYIKVLVKITQIKGDDLICKIMGKYNKL